MQSNRALGAELLGLGQIKKVPSARPLALSVIQHARLGQMHGLRYFGRDLPGPPLHPQFLARNPWRVQRSSEATSLGFIGPYQLPVFFKVTTRSSHQMRRYRSSLLRQTGLEVVRDRPSHWMRLFLDASRADRCLGVALTLAFDIPAPNRSLLTHNLFAVPVSAAKLWRPPTLSIGR